MIHNWDHLLLTVSITLYKIKILWNHYDLLLILNKENHHFHQIRTKDRRGMINITEAHHKMINTTEAHHRVIDTTKTHHKVINTTEAHHKMINTTEAHHNTQAHHKVIN